MATRTRKPAKKATAKKPATKKTSSPPKQTAAPEAYNGSVSHLIHRAGQCSTDIFGAIAPNGVVTPRQYAILEAIRDNPGVSQTRLVDITGIDRSTLADIVKRMLQKDLVQRERTKTDARAYAVKLTRKGANTIKKMQPHAETVDREILAAIPKEHRSLFVSLLAQMVEKLSARGENEGQ